MSLAACEPLPLIDRFFNHATIEQGWIVNSLICDSSYTFSQYLVNGDTNTAVAVLENSTAVIIIYPDGFKDYRPDRTIEIIRDF